MRRVPPVLLLFLFVAVPLRGLEDISMNSPRPTVCICDRVEVLEDRTGKLDFDGVRSLTDGFRPYTRKSFNFGYSRSAFWIRGVFINDDTGPYQGPWVLETDFPWFFSFDLYLTGPDGKTAHYGQIKKQPFGTRVIQNRNFTFPLVLKKGRTSFLIRATGNPLHFNLAASPATVFLAKAQLDYFLMGIYYGIIFLIILISFVLYVRIRETVYIYNILFMASMGLLEFTLNGLSFQYLWPGLTVWHEISPNFLPGLSILLGSIMCRHFLETKKYTPVMDKVLYFFQAVAIADMFFALLQNQPVCLVMINILMIGIPPLFIVMGVACIRKGFYPARYFLLTFVVQAVLLLIYALREQGFLPNMLVTEYSIQIAILVQVLFLVLAMFDRVNLSAKEKQKLQQELQFNLERQVKERTTELEMYATTDTMTGVYNRRIGFLLLEEEIHKAKRNKSVLTICFIDINGLKEVNDSFGHREGDELILMVVEILKESLRESDIICRMGGDEFLVIMADCNMNQSLSVWEGIQTKIDEKNRAILKSYSISVSRGFAEFNPIYPITPDELITTADYQMYQHKKRTKKTTNGN